MNKEKGYKKEWYYDYINYKKLERTEDKVQEVSKYPDLDKTDELEFAFTHALQDYERSLFNQIKLIIDEAINSNSYLLICSFIINNFEIIELIQNAATKLRGKIYILLGKKKHSFISYKKNYGLMEKSISTLAKSGVLIRYMPNAHLKFIINGKKSLILTANLTTEGLFKNPEFGIVLKNDSICRQLNRLFSYLWFKKSTQMLINNNWREVPNNESYSFGKKILQTVKSELLMTSDSIIRNLNQKSQILKNKSLFEVLKESLAEAKESIDIAVYKFNIPFKNRLEELEKILIQKAKDKISVRLLVPVIKTQYDENMRQILKKLEENGIKIKYYRELHGKCVILDKNKAFLLTGNIDNYLIKDDSCDIGYNITNPITVKNLNIFYNHLWKEAADRWDIFTPIDLHIDLVINSYYAIFKNSAISLSRLNHIIQDSEKIQFYWYENEALLEIHNNHKKLRLYIDLEDESLLDFQEETFYLSGLLRRRSRYIGEKNYCTVNKLELKLLWEE
ncbi:MAG: phospholipase D-like domain-containing protein [Candidatus Helarchaeota archaeon]